MGSLDVEARCIIRRAILRERSRAKVAAIYDIPPELVEWYLLNKDCGTLHARGVIRIEIARLAAEKKGVKNFKPRKEDKYKGTR